MGIPFVKMHGLGNDFVVIDDLQGAKSDLTTDLARKICDRRFGIGADQILWLRHPQVTETQADARMEILNSDGSVAEMCGNGIRAVALYLYDSGPKPRQKDYLIETLAGLKKVTITGRDVAVDMGAPGLYPKSKEGEVIEVTEGRISQRFTFHEVSMGNPHAVIFSDNVEKIALEEIGPLLENHPRFPKKTNVEFVQVISSSEIRVRVWERGAGITLACGTGACASATAALYTGRVKGQVKVGLPGGALLIDWAGEGQPLIMQGPATEVFRGEYLG
jgi:diaminopimelate epimerase